MNSTSIVSKVWKLLRHGARRWRRLRRRMRPPFHAATSILATARNTINNPAKLFRLMNVGTATDWAPLYVDVK